MATKNTNELNDLDSHIVNVINQLKKQRKRAEADATLYQIIKINDCVGINSDFLAAHLNDLLEHNVIIKKKYNSIESYSINENAQTLDLIEIFSSCTPDKPILNTSNDTNEVEINTTLEYSLNISTIDTPTCRNLPYDCQKVVYNRSLWHTFNGNKVNLKNHYHETFCS